MSKTLCPKLGAFLMAQLSVLLLAMPAYAACSDAEYAEYSETLEAVKSGQESSTVKIALEQSAWPGGSVRLYPLEKAAANPVVANLGSETLEGIVLEIVTPVLSESGCDREKLFTAEEVNTNSWSLVCVCYTNEEGTEVSSIDESASVTETYLFKGELAPGATTPELFSALVLTENADQLSQPEQEVKLMPHARVAESGTSATLAGSSPKTGDMLLIFAKLVFAVVLVMTCIAAACSRERT